MTRFCIFGKDDVSFSYKYEITPLSKIAKMILFQKIHLNSDSHLPKKFFVCFNDSPSKVMKNAFYFILKALFVLKIFKFLS